MHAPRSTPALLLVVALAGAAAFVALRLPANPAAPATPPPSGSPASAPASPVASSPAGAPLRHAVTIRPGPATPVVVTDALNKGGAPVPVACATCHVTKAPRTETHSAEQLKEFHQGLAFRHGGLSCLSCHNAANYDTLRKADGTAVAYPRVMELCAQCHGPQYRDYQAGAHGGMNGHWDLTRGPRSRNNCVDCHDPHAPAYPTVLPVFAPVDRGALEQRLREGTHDAHAPRDASRHE